MSVQVQIESLNVVPGKDWQLRVMWCDDESEGREVVTLRPYIGCVEVQTHDSTITIPAHVVSEFCRQLKLAAKEAMQ